MFIRLNLLILHTPLDFKQRRALDNLRPFRVDRKGLSDICEGIFGALAVLGLFAGIERDGGWGKFVVIRALAKDRHTIALYRARPRAWGGSARIDRPTAARCRNDEPDALPFSGTTDAHLGPAFHSSFVQCTVRFTNCNDNISITLAYQT